jgi:hypothetical protein
MLKLIGNELLPLSNSKQLEYEEVKYLSFDEALDSVAGEENDTVESDSDTEVQSQSQSKSALDSTEFIKKDIDDEILQELKLDIAGMF